MKDVLLGREKEVLDLVAQVGVVKAAAALGVHRSSITRLMTRLRNGSQAPVDTHSSLSEIERSERGLNGYEPVLEGFAIKETTTTYDGDGEIERQSVKQTKAPGAAFALPDGQEIKGISALLDPQGRKILEWVKTGKGRIDPGAAARAVREALEGMEATAPFVEVPAYVDDDLLTVYLLPDLHFGMLAWGPESGEDWDLTIAMKTIEDAFDRLVSGSPPSKKAIVLGLGDLLHADGNEPMTARSKNILDVDSRWAKVLRTSTRMIARSVLKVLAKHEQVAVRILPGNHDTESAESVSNGLAMYFEALGNPRIFVDDDPEYVWYHAHGTTLLAATHGDAAKMADLPLQMAVDNPEAWGRSTFRYAFTGHIHHKSVIEKAGVIVESLQAPGPSDAWHAKMGYRAGRSLTAVTYHNEMGEVGRTRAGILAKRRSKILEAA